MTILRFRNGGEFIYTDFCAISYIFRNLIIYLETGKLSIQSKEWPLAFRRTLSIEKSMLSTIGLSHCSITLVLHVSHMYNWNLRCFLCFCVSPCPL